MFTLFAGLASAAFLSAQQQPPAPSVDDVLNQWEKAMTGMKSFTAEIKREELDKSFDARSKDVWTGWAKFQKGQGTASRASYYLRKQMAQPSADPPFEYVLCSGNFLYQFSQATKEIIVYEMPQNQGGQVTDDNILAFLFGRSAAMAKQRYEMNLIPIQNAQQKEWYHFVQIKPRQEADKADFAEARLVLWAKGGTAYLPVEFWFRQPTGKEVTWAFSKVVPNAEIPATDFAAPTNPPQGWQLKKAPTPQMKARN
jgi:TIGR03009 family protein